MALTFKQRSFLPTDNDLKMLGHDGGIPVVFAIDLAMARTFLAIDAPGDVVPALNRWRALLKKACRTAYGRRGGKATIHVIESDFEADTAPRGGKILVVDDEVFIALFYTELLEAAGYTVLGPAFRIEPALALLRTTRPDAAIIDLNLNGRMALPVLDALIAAGIPFGVLSAHVADVMPSAYRMYPRLSKPVAPEELGRFIEGLIVGASSSPGQTAARTA